jgi:hypothetical protein
MRLTQYIVMTLSVYSDRKSIPTVCDHNFSLHMYYNELDLSHWMETILR